MRSRSLLLAAALAVPLGALGPARATHVEWAHGHITAGGPWTGFRSVTVVTDSDSVDGFFFPAPPEGWTVQAVATRDGSCTIYNYCLVPYDLNVNWHGPIRTLLGRNWLGGCNTSEPEPECTAPADACTGEVTAAKGVDLDVSVRLVAPHDAGPPGPDYDPCPELSTA